MNLIVQPRTYGEVWKGLECRSFCPHRGGVCPSPRRACVHQPGSSLKPVQWGALWRPQHAQLQPLYFPAGWWVGVAESPKLLILAWSFWLPAPSRSHPRAHLESHAQNKRCSCHSGTSKGFWSSVSGIGVQDQLLEQKMLLVFLWQLQSFRSCVLGTGAETNYMFLMSQKYTMKTHPTASVPQPPGSHTSSPCEGPHCMTPGNTLLRPSVEYGVVIFL